MHILIILLSMTVALRHNISRANDTCGPLPEIPNTVRNTEKVYERGQKIRLQCVDGYVRKAGTSNQIVCTNQSGKNDWHSLLPLKCIPDPKKPRTTETPRSHQHFTSSTTERTEIKSPTILATSMPTTATGHLTLTTTNEVVTSKTGRTTNQPTLKSTTKEAESITTTNEITSATSSSLTSRHYMTTASSHTQSSSYTTTTAVSVFENGRDKTKESEINASSGNYISTASGVTSVIILCLVATGLILWWRLRHRNPNDTIYIPVAVFGSEHCSNPLPKSSTTDSVNDTYQPQTDSANGANRCDRQSPQEDLRP